MKKSALAEKVLFFLDMIRLLLCLPIGLLLFRLKEIYIVCERGTDARDNGYHLFKYIVENHPEKNVYYIIDKRSADYPKVARLGKVIHYRSWKHVLFFVASRIKISSHYMGYAPGMPYRFQKLQRYLRLPGKYVFLQHGITQNDLIGLYAERAHIDLFVCGARPEYEFVSSRFGHPQGVVRYTGLARYDNLHGHPTKREILIMPTWRKYLSGMNKDEFTRSEYFSAWSGLLNDSRLTSLLRENEIKLIFYPHYEMQKFVNCFSSDDENVIIADFNKYDVQQLLIDAKLLITDYSSVFFDFAYMKKPCICYQFDKKDFYSQHYKKGYFDYSENGFGDVPLTFDELLESINRIVKADFEPDAIYVKRMEEFFELHDNMNCKRIYEAIEALK